MAKFCGKCGGPLDQNGRCPRCEGTTVPHVDPGIEKPLTRKEKKALKKANMSFGQKTKRFFKRLLIFVLVLAILAGSCAGALVVLDAKGNPFAKNLLGWFGMKDDDPEPEPDNHFASVSGKFTDRKIYNAEDAILAAQDAAPQLGLTNAVDELTLQNESTVDGVTYYRLQQNYNDIPVYGKTIVISVDSDHNAKDVTSNLIDIPISINTNSKITDADIKKTIANVSEEELATKQLVFFEKNNQLYLCYHINTIDSEFYIDATSGEIIYQQVVRFTNTTIGYDSSGSIKISVNYDEAGNIYQMIDNNRLIYTYSFERTNSSNAGATQTLITSDNEWFGDTDAERALEEEKAVIMAANIAKIRDFFNNRFSATADSKMYICYNDGWCSGDNGYASSAIDLSTQESVGVISIGFNKDLNSIDLLAHEYMHRVEQNISRLNYSGESGAIMEAYSDVFGELLEDYFDDNSINGSCNWIHNQGRNLISPLKSGDPNKYFGLNFQKDLEPKFNSNNETINDMGGVHKNSTVISHAAYLMRTGVKGKTALSMERLAKLWFHTLSSLHSNSSFMMLRNSMEMTAERLGYSDAEKECISAAFDEVDVGDDSDDGIKIDLDSEVQVYDKNGSPYEGYTITVDGKEYTGWFGWGWVTKDYHNEIHVDSTDPQSLSLKKGNYSVTITDDFSGQTSQTRKIKARKDQDKKILEFSTIFGCDYNMSPPGAMTVQDINGDNYNNYSVRINGKKTDGADYATSFSVDYSTPVNLGLSAGGYSIVLTDNKDSTKRKSFTLRVVDDERKDSVVIKTSFGESYGDYDDDDVPEGAATNPDNGHRYYVYDIPGITTWEGAKQFCRSKNGYLATLTSVEENRFVFGYMRDMGFQNAYFGLYDSGYNEWKWVTNEAYQFDNWADGEPNSGSENYGMYYNTASGQWNDGDFGNHTSEDRAFICEWGAFEQEEEEEEQPQEPERQTSDKRDIVLVLDVSGSMSGDKLEQTKKASVNFINTILQEDASIGIVVYDDSARQVADLSMNATYLTDIANGIGSGGSTNIEDGLVKAVNMLDYSNAEKQIIVLMSDGEPNSGKVGDELVNYAQTIKDSGTYIYTLGFFGNYSGQSAAQTLMERIASDGCHYEVSDADNLKFFFGDIADTINGQQYIYIRIACPVDVSVTYNGETLNSSVDDLSTRTSFGSLSFEENTERESTDGDDRIKVLRLKADDKYDVQIVGTGTGRMNYTIGFMDENGEYSDFRRFNNVKINRHTVIDTVADYTKNTVLNVDEDGDGKYDLKYKAGENERGKVVDHSVLIYCSVAAVFLIAVFIIIMIIRKKIQKKKGLRNNG